MNNSYWETIQINLQKNHSVQTIQTIGDSVIFIGGSINNDGKLNIENGKPFFCYSIDKGKNWIEKNDFNCNTIEHIYLNKNILMIRGLKYVGDTSLSLGSTTIFYKFLFNEKKFYELLLPANRKEGKNPIIIDENIYVINVTKNQFGNTYLVTNDGGKTWNEHTILMKHKSDKFEEKYYYSNHIWGVKTHLPNFKSIVSVDVSIWEVSNEIILQHGENVIYLYCQNDKLFVLTQIGFTCYIKQINYRDKSLIIQDTFSLAENEYPVSLFYFNNRQIIVTINAEQLLPIYTLLYKRESEKTWTRELFPEFTYPYMSFSNSVLMGIYQKDKLFYRKF